MNIKIRVPDNNQAERSYIVSVLLADFLGLEYHMEFDNSIDNYVIEFENKTLLIQDAFFGKYRDVHSYLRLENIPQYLQLFYNELLSVDPVPIIYGENNLIMEEDKIFCGLDIFASSFFMLSRWEEVVITQKDIHGRCDENEMFVVKQNLYQYPIVNEYVELLRELLKQIGVKNFVCDRVFTPFITHDIDYLFRYGSLKNVCRNFVGDILHRKSLKIFFKTCIDYVSYRRGEMKDPFDTFDELMDLSDSYGFINAFYFKSSLFREYDATYNVFDPKVKTIIDNIRCRGHEVGIHPSKNTFHNDLQFQLECERLKSLGVNIKGGRQHFLLYDLPETLQSWNNEGIEYDAGLGFASHGGFRCGTCYEYPFFDVKMRKKLPLKIRPLIVMEGALLRKNNNLHLIEKEIRELVDIVYRYKGIFVFLWHNDNFKRYESLRYAHVYKNVIDYLGFLSKNKMQT